MKKLLTLLLDKLQVLYYLFNLSVLISFYRKAAIKRYTF